MTGEAKLPGIRDYVNYLVDNSCKFLNFAHHSEVLDAIEDVIIDDKIGHGKALLLSMAIAVTIQIVFLSIAPLSSLLSPAAFMLGFAYTSYCVVLPGMSGELFGNKDFSRIWACIMSVGSISTAISIPAYGTIFDKTGSYTSVFILIAVLCIICIVSSFMALKFAKK
jgi:MFS family permease